MFAAVIVIGSCSRSSKPVALQQPIQPMAPVSAPARQLRAGSGSGRGEGESEDEKAPATTVSYVNREYGVSFSFPRKLSA